MNQKISMNGVTPSIVDDPRPTTTIRVELETDINMQTVESLVKKEPFADDLASPSEHTWIKEEIFIEDNLKEKNRQRRDWMVDVKKEYLCFACSYCCDNKHSLIVHVRIHTGEKPYVCDVCKSKFRTSGHLKRHILKHTGEKPYKCDLCTSRFGDVTTLKNHVRVHTGEKPYVCGVCKARFAQVGNLRCHERTHRGDIRFVCDVCEAKFTTSSHLTRHKRRHTGEKPYGCESCESRFRDLRTLKNHARVHSGEKPYVCGDCEARFTQVGQLKRHERTHTGKKHFACDICGLEYSRASTLKKHKIKHTSLDDNDTYTDDVTSSVVSDPHHHTTIEDELETDQTILTGKSLTKKEPAVDDLAGPSKHAWIKAKNSIVEAHEEEENHMVDLEKRHLCFACRYNSNCLEDLNVHIKVHTGEKPHVCNVCGAKFKTSNLLRKHKLRTKHGLTVEKLSVHDVGASRFGDFTTLKNNMGDKRRYVCNFCGLRCSLANALNIHKRAHVSLDDQDIPMDNDSPSVFDDAHPHTTIENNRETDITIQTFESLIKKEPGVDELACPSEHDWIKMDETDETDVWIKVEELHRRI